MDDARYYSIPDAARRCGVDAAAISSLVKSQRITAFIALPVLLAHPPKELRRPGNPPTFTYVSGMYALDATAGAALAAGHPTPIDKVWRYGEYTEGDYRNHGPVLLKDPYTPAPADLHVNIDEVQALLHPLKATPGRETAADMPATEAGRRLQENAVAAKKQALSGDRGRLLGVVGMRRLHSIPQRCCQYRTGPSPVQRSKAAEPLPDKKSSRRQSPQERQSPQG